MIFRDVPALKEPTATSSPRSSRLAMPALAGTVRGGTARSLKDAGLRLQSYVYRRPPPWDSWRTCGLPATESFDEALSWPRLDTRPLSLDPVDVPQTASVPTLAHGLQQVLRGSGLFPLHAPWDRASACPSNSRAADYLRRIVPPEQIVWENMPRYVPAKDDASIHALAASLAGVHYASSTSSMTPTLATLYHLISNFRDTELLGGLSPRMSELPVGFTRLQKRPSAFMLTPVSAAGETPVFAVNAHDADSTGPRILLELGNSIERMLTTSAAEFERTFVRGGARPAGAAERPAGDGEQFYHYSRASQFLLRAQIDARNPDNDEVFDVKTRAVAAIRYNLANYSAFRGARLRSLRGVSDSYEREFYDMVRSVFIKYALQLRIGRMSGALIAYHNTAEMLGLEFVDLREIEMYVFGGSMWADLAFAASMRLLEEILARVREALFAEGETAPVKVLLATERSRRRMTVYAHRVAEDGDDELGPERFSRIAKEAGFGPNAPKDPLQCRDFWHADADLHRTTMPGVAVVGTVPGVIASGGEQVLHAAAGNKPRRRGVSNSPIHELGKHDTSRLVPRKFYVWHVDVAPFVRGKLAPKGAINVENKNDFELRYTIDQVKNITDYVKAEYVTDLGRLYTP